MYYDEIVHSDIYLGKDFSDGIRHWKYIKREKLSNGKYRYYYKDDKLDELRRQESSAEKQYLLKHLKTSIKDSDFVKDYAESQKRGLYTNTDSRELYKLEKKYETTAKKVRNYYIATTPRRIISKGIAAIANLFQKFKF